LFLPTYVVVVLVLLVLVVVVVVVVAVGDLGRREEAEEAGLGHLALDDAGLLAALVALLLGLDLDRQVLLGLPVDLAALRLGVDQVVVLGADGVLERVRLGQRRVGEIVVLVKGERERVGLLIVFYLFICVSLEMRDYLFIFFWRCSSRTKASAAMLSEMSLRAARAGMSVSSMVSAIMGWFWRALSQNSGIPLHAYLITTE